MKNRMVKKLTAAFLAITMVISSPVIPEISAKAADNTPSLTIDMGETGKRELYHGATGWLYGQGDDQVPTANTITALKPNTAVQKAPNGMQHPNGDVLDIAKTFMDAGGKHIQIYVPDYYALWFYEFTGTDYYLDILRMQAEACIEAGIAEDVVYVLYNEPTANWLGSDGYVDDNGNKVTGWDSMYWYWKKMVETLREVYEDAGIETAPKTAGLNLAVYDKTVMDGYIKFCAEYDVMPDIVSWHDLATWQYNIFDEEYNHYRGLEEKYGVEPREIVINEYAAQAECASPGDLVRWIGLWEDYEVAGCLPFWHFSNNLNGLAANNNAGNGAWWLYKWYGDMSGSYLPVSVSNAQQNDFYGVASMDENKKSANVVFGGRDGSANIILDDILSTETFANAEKVHIKVEGTDYTGFHGAAEEPRVIKEGTVAVENGQALVPMTDMNSMSGYRITVTQAADDENLGLLTASWKVKYEAENGTLTGAAVVANGDNNYACSNRKKVHMVDNPGDSVTMEISVPYDGYYKYDYVYCAATGVDTNSPSTNNPYTAIQNLSIDGELVDEMTLSSTLHWAMGGMYSKYLYLTAGSHSLKIEATSSQGKAVPDCIYLTYEGKEEVDTLFDMTYEAELGEFNEIKGQTTTLTTSHDGRIGYITGLEARRVTDGGGVRFNTVVPENGMYTITLRYQSQQNATANLYLDNDMTNLNHLRAAVALNATGDEWKTVYQEVFLQEGINVIDIDTVGAVKLDSMRVRGTEGSAPAASIEAETGTLSGDASLGEQAAVQQFASGSGYVSAIKAANDVEMIPKDDDEFTILGLGRVVDKGEDVDKNSLTINVNAPKAGSYKLVVYQSNGELFGKHSYNAQMTERYASFSVNGGTAKKVVFRNTYSDETFMPQVVDVELQAGNNTIKIFNDNSKVITNGVLKSGKTEHRPENIDYAVLTNYTPNFDKFELYALTGNSGAEQNTYEISARTTEGGRIEAEKTQVTAGGSVKLLFVPDDGYRLKEAYINGSSIMNKLTEVGGYYTVYPVSQDIEANAYFEPESEKEQITRQADFEYAVNAGDIDPTTLSAGDSFGLRNSVTEQFYAADKVTGKSWGLIGEEAEADASHPGWLTGSKTWPCENDGATDSSTKEKSFRYAKDQKTTDAGIVYQFELESNETYDVEMGFYVPSSWTNANNPRTMKLVVNDNVVNGYNNFTASNDDSKPYKINTQMTADAQGMLKIQIGHADNAVWGPVISYLEIFRQADTTVLEAEMEACKDLQESDYDSKSWQAFRTAKEAAQSVLDNSGSLTNIRTINDALYDLQVAKSQLKAAGATADKSELKAEYEKYKDYVQTTGQGLTSDEDWTEFQNALDNALFLQQTNASETVIAGALNRLNQAVGRLAVLSRLAVTKNPAKTVYYVGDALDLTGLEVTAYDQNGKAYVLGQSQFTVGNFDFSSVGTKTITVSFQNQTAQFAVEVKARTDENQGQGQVQAPAVPKITKGTCSYNSIQVKWGKVNGASGYEIYRSTSKNKGYGLVKKIEKPDTTSFKDTKLNFNKTYYYKIKSYTQNGATVAASGFSNTLKAKTSLAKPVVKAKKKSATSINVSWKKVSGASGYKLQYSLKKKSGYKSVMINKKNAKSYTLKGLEPKKTYYVKVCAFRKVKSKKVYGSWSKVKTFKLR